MKKTALILAMCLPIIYFAIFTIWLRATPARSAYVSIEVLANDSFIYVMILGLILTFIWLVKEDLAIKKIGIMVKSGVVK